VDSASEVEVLLNGESIGFAAVTADQSWSGEQSLSLPDAEVNDTGINILVFSNTRNPPNTWWWGVRNVAVGTP
jgi:hypothetical protein